MNGKEKILVIKLSALGDFVQSLGPMAAIRKHHKDADITLLTTAPFVSFGRDCGYFDHIWIDDRPKWYQPAKWLELAKKLNGAGFTRVYDLQNNDRTALYFKLFRNKPEWSGTVKGCSHENKELSALKEKPGHAFDRQAQTLAIAGIDNITIDPMEWVKGDIGHLGIDEPYVLLVPGCSPGRPEKRWPASYYGTLARNIYGWNYLPVIIGTKDETPLAEEIRKGCPQALDLTGKTALTDIILLARSAAAAIGNDTGPMHLITPTGCPGYVLFSGHSDPVKHKPLGPIVKTIQSDELAELTPEDVLAQIKPRDFRNSRDYSGQ